MNWLRKILLDLLIKELLKNGSLTKREWKIMHEQRARLWASKK